MKDTDYVYAVARVRVHELSLLTKADIASLIGADSIDSLLRRLSEKGYDTSLNPSEMLLKEEENNWSFIQEILPDKHEFDSLIIKNDFHNLKAMLKCIINLDKPSDYYLFPSVYDPEAINSSIEKRRFDALPACFSEVAADCYDLLTRTRSGQKADSLLDRACLIAEKELSKKSSSDMLYLISCARIAFSDIKVCFRAILSGKDAGFYDRALCEGDDIDIKEMKNAALGGMDAFLGYVESTKYASAAAALRVSAAAFEKHCDDYVIQLVNRGKMTAFGPDPIAAYYIAKQTELLTVRIIISAKINGIDSSVIEQRVRELYV